MKHSIILTESEPTTITEVYVQCHETGQVAMIKDKKIVYVREKSDALLFPPGHTRIFEVAIFENVPADYIEALVKGNVTLGKEAYELKISNLINTLLK